MRTPLFVLAAAVMIAPLQGVSIAIAAPPDFFVPNQPQRAPQPAQPRSTPQRAPVRQPAPQPEPPIIGPQAGPGDQGDGDQLPPLALQQQPLPELPPLPKGAPPPAAVIGVMGVPEVMRASSAAQQVEKVIGERREKLNEDAQKEQAVWREMQQALANDRGKLSPEQIRSREQALQDRITNAQKTFRERNRIIQESAQVALGQIERELIAVIRQVAESRGMNLVLHRAQVALNVNEFDITDQVAEQMNKLMPSVTIPPDGVSPLAQQQQPANLIPGAATLPTSGGVAAPPTRR